MDIRKFSVDEYVELAIKAHAWESHEDWTDWTTVEKEAAKLNFMHALFRAMNGTCEERLPIPEYLKMENRTEVATLVADAINDLCEPDYS